MADLTDREQEFVAIGAAVASNCVPCIEYHIPEARKAGIGDSQIREALALADRVRRVPAREVLARARSLLCSQDSGPGDEDTHAEGSCCSSAA